jgi:hypothetical protein
MTLILNGTDNSATTPAVTGTDTDTGVYYPAANQVALATNGTLALIVDSSQKVGIGTSSPSNKLEVKGGNGNQLILDNAGEAYTQMTFKSNGTNRAAIWATAAELGLYTYSTQSLIFYTNTTERARFNTTGAFVLAGGTTTANGVGIVFPATQSASTNANTLDDYEEGTWTPTFTNNTGTITYTVQLGNYVKAGKIVQCEVYIRCSGVAGTGTVYLSLPIVTSNFSDPGAFSYNDAGHTVGVTSTADNPRMRIDASALTLEGVKSLGNTTYLSYNELCSGGTLEFAVLFSYISLD